MMPDLGKYQDAVLSAYAVSLLALIAIIALSVWRSRAVKRQLAQIEAQLGEQPK